MILTKQEWLCTRNRDLADLYFYSLTFNSPDSEKYLEQWLKDYGEIESLFYFKENEIEPTSQFLLTHHQKYNFSHQNLAYYQDLVIKGLKFHNVIYFINFSIINKKTDIFDFFFDMQTHNETSFRQIASMIVRKNAPSINLIDNLLAKNKNLKIISEEKAYAYMLGLSLMPDKIKSRQYIKDLSTNIYSKVLQELKEIIQKTPNNFRIMTKSGEYGSGEEIKSFINSELEALLCKSLREQKIKKQLKI